MYYYIVIKIKEVEIEVKTDKNEIILNKLQEFRDKMWLSRHLHFVKIGMVTKELHPEAFNSENIIREKYNWKDYNGETDEEWAFIRGARHSLEFVTGNKDWDDITLDT